MQITPASLQAIFNIFNTRFQTAFTKTETVWDQYAMLQPSGTAQETYAWMDFIPGLRKWVGERVVNNLLARAQVIINDKFEDTIGVQRTAIEDDTIGLYSPRFDMLGRASKIWPDQLVTAAVTGALTNLCYDGTPFFYNAHPINVDNPSGATYQNRFDASANGGGVAFPCTAQNVTTILTTMQSYLGLDGAPIGVQPSLLMGPPALWPNMKQICEMDIIAQAFGSNVAQAQSNAVKGLLRPISNPYLTDPNRYYVIAVNLGVMPFIFQQRIPPTLTPMDQETATNVFLRDQYLYGVRARGASGTSLPFICATGSSSAS